MAKTGKVTATKSVKAAVPKTIVNHDVSDGDPSLRQQYVVTDKSKLEDIIRYAEMPGIDLVFDFAHFLKLDDSFVAMLPANAQKAYWLTLAEYESRKRLADRAVFETPNAVDPRSKLLDGPHGMSNPLVHDQDEVQKLIGRDWYITWRVEGGQGDLEGALKAGFKVMRKPKDDTERKTKSPLEWTGERWKIPDGTVDPSSGEAISNVMVYIRQQAWKDNIDAMSMISHNAYSQNKRQFIEGVDNISRDMLSSKERIEVSNLDELHVEEHTEVQDGKRISVSPGQN